MNYQEIKNKIELVAKHFSERVHVSGRENSLNYAAGIEYLEKLAASIVIPQETEAVKKD